MNDVLTFEEMKERFPREWVLIGDPMSDDQLRLKGGKVLFHSKDRDETDRKALELRPPYFAIRYTGPIPEAGLEMLL